MEIEFVKYQGTGNDFIMIDNHNGSYNDLSISQIEFLCNRKIGVGADGLIKLSKKEGVDFVVEYFNADGTQSFCGNGARCSVAFAKELGWIKINTRFLAIDGYHNASIIDGIVRLEMLPVKSFEKKGEDFFLDTGSPHYIHFDHNEELDILSYGKEIRFSEEYKKVGVNVNLVNSIDDTTIQVKTYERGVEDETLSCGTGVTACALVFMLNSDLQLNKVNINTKGGVLSVESDSFLEKIGFTNIWLSGPANKVFDGRIDV